MLYFEFAKRIFNMGHCPPPFPVMPGPDRASPRGLVGNMLCISDFLKILVPFCDEDFQHLAEYQ